MRRIDTAKAMQLTHLVSPHYPNQRIMLITDGSLDLHGLLHDFTAARGFEFDCKCVDCDVAIPEPHEGCRIEPLELSARQYNKHARQYENIFVAMEPASYGSDLDDFLKKCYRIVKNAGILTLLIPKGAAMNEGIEERLVGCNYVAVGRVDIFDDYEVITAKKLHGWERV
ncbi:hypothetical protein [Hydrogenimonas sp.]